MPDASVDLVLISPPYADKRDHGDVDGTIPPDEYVDWFIPKAKEISFDDLAPYVKVLYSDTDTPYIGEVTGELNQVVAQLTQNIEEVKNSVSDISGLNNTNHEQITGLSDILGELTELSQNINKAMTSINDSVSGFSETTDNISNIAHQINILSINASIKAARGRSGQGLRHRGTRSGKACQ